MEIAEGRRSLCPSVTGRAVLSQLREPVGGSGVRFTAGAAALGPSVHSETPGPGVRQCE